jgi:signal transduction histidine kinase
MKLSLALLFILLFTAVSISVNDDEENEYLLHAESSERLITIMQQLFSLAKGSSIEEKTKPTEDDMLDIVEAVEELLFYAELMSVKVPATELEESKSVIFSAMAGQLYDEVLNIQQLTTNYDLHIIDNSQQNLFDDAFRRLSQTCAACHQLFRDN